MANINSPYAFHLNVMSNVLQSHPNLCTMFDVELNLHFYSILPLLLFLASQDTKESDDESKDDENSNDSDASSSSQNQQNGHSSSIRQRTRQAGKTKGNGMNFLYRSYFLHIHFQPVPWDCDGCCFNMLWSITPFFCRYVPHKWTRCKTSQVW